MPASQVFAAAFGAEQPVASNADEKGRALNRRVEMAPVPRAAAAQAHRRRRCDDRRQAGGPPWLIVCATPADDAPRTLAELNAYIRRVTAARRDAGPRPPAGASDELASVRGFREAWSRNRTLDQLQQAVSRTPANAGPLNSHALVLRSLELMGELSPDYLRRFIVQVETLQWLQRAAEQYPRQRAAEAKQPSRGRRKK